MEILNGIAFNSQPKAYWPSKMAMNPVRLRLTVKRNRVHLPGTCHFAPCDQANTDPQILLAAPSFNRYVA